MIVRSLRLKNIKSYGEGPDGDGVTIAFEPGINRIAGRNGHGKTTLIESLGFALFLARPIFEENFDAATYLVRAGKKAGEIDVVFEHDGAAYRLERGLGSASQRRAKVVQLSDGSLCAEGDAEVSAFLCRLLGLGSVERLTEVFAKLVGVKQGRLAWPFDSKPAEARRHFEPLLDVEIFRQCFDRLKPVADRFENLSHEQRTKLAVIEDRLRERRDSVESLPRAEAQVREFEGKAKTAKAELQAAAEHQQQLEAREKAAHEAQRACEAAQHALTVATEKCQGSGERVREAKAAAEIVAQTAAAHAAYLAAEKQLAELNARQAERRRSEKLRSESIAQRTKLEEQAVAARQQAATFAGQREAKAKTHEENRRAVDALEKQLEETKAGFEERAAGIAAAREHEAKVRGWLAHVDRHLAACAQRATELETAAKKLAAWNGAALHAARESEQRAAQNLERVSSELAAARQAHATMETQLAEISGGTCPFLKERCRQFDPAKVRADLQTATAAIARLEKEATAAREAHAAAKVGADRLARDEAQLAPLRETITRRLEEFARDCDGLFPPDLRVAIERLGGAAPALSAVPREAWAGQLDLVCAQAAERVGEVRVWFERAAAELARRAATHEAERDRRAAQEQELKHRRAQGAELEAEMAKLAESAATRTADAERFTREAEQSAKTIAQLDAALQTFASLDAQLAEQQRLKTDHADGYRRHLGAKPTADQLAAREKAEQECVAVEKEAAAQLAARRTALDAAQREFDAPALEAARAAFQQRNKEVAEIDVHLGNARTELAREQKRHAEFLAAQKEKDAIESELGRLRAAGELTQKARTVLQKAAPHVAQHLCRRIAARAQQIFNQINPEPVEIEWDAKAYSLRIAPGERRFAMLSGGEQTKLALAMTLAMIQQFSGLKFCVFDEPTYGVDADSRAKLADAIVEAQRAAGLEQLLLVSHDDAFEGKIEHVVLLSKSAGSGTRVEAVTG